MIQKILYFFSTKPICTAYQGKITPQRYLVEKGIKNFNTIAKRIGDKIIQSNQ